MLSLPQRSWRHSKAKIEGNSRFLNRNVTFCELYAQVARKNCHKRGGDILFRRALFSFIGLAGIAFIGTFAFALWVLGSPARMPGTGGEARISRVEEGAELVRNFILDDGLRGATLISSIRNEWVGLSSLEFAQNNPQWRVVSFGPNRIVVEEPCDTTGGGFVRLEGDQVIVFDGNMDGCYVRRGSIELDADTFSPFHIRELESGIPFSNEVDLSIVLEGMRAP